MDAASYLSRYGWTGGGLGYRQSGIKKPLLVARKQGFSGIGGRSIECLTNQWWLGAFNDGLKNIEFTDNYSVNKSTSGPSHHRATGLYQHFIQGASLEGTLSPNNIGHQSQIATTSSSPSSDSKRAMPANNLVSQDSKRTSEVRVKKLKTKKKKKRKRGGSEVGAKCTANHRQSCHKADTS